MRYVVLVMVLSGCAMDIDREVDGYESYQGLCLYCYSSVGEKDTLIDKEIDEEKVDEAINKTQE